MRRTGTRKLSKAFIALILVIISFVMLVSPWVNISIDVLGREYSFPDLLDLLCQYEGITAAQFELNLQAEIADLTADLAEDTGVIMNAKDATKAINKVLDGGLSLLDAATVSTYAGGLLKDIDEAMNRNFANLYASERVTLIMINEAASSLRIAAIVLWVMIAALCITFIFAVFTLLTYRKNGTIAYTIVLAVPVVAVIFGVASMNDALQSYAGVVTDYLDDIMWLLGGGNQGTVSLELFHMTAAPIIALACAVVATLIMVIGDVRIPVMKGSAVPNFKWTCSCGFQNSLGNAFCSACGQKRPEKPRCECGALIVTGTKFCGRCGSPIERVELDDIAPPPPPPRKCPRCGSFMDGGVCKRCANEVEQPRRCTRCGAPVYGNNTLCESCKNVGSGLSGDLWNKGNKSDLD